MMLFQNTGRIDALDEVIVNGCTPACEIIGMFGSALNIPVITYGCRSDDLSDSSKYPTLTRTVGNVSDLAYSFLEFALKQEWKRVAIIYSSHIGWILAAQKFKAYFKANGMMTEYPDLELDYDNVKKQMYDLKYKYSGERNKILIAVSNVKKSGADFICCKHDFIMCHY